jgi:hypothetical protein
VASPTEAEIQSQIGKAIKIVDQIFRFGSVNGTNLVGLYDALVDALETNFAGEVAAGADAIRAQVASAIPLGRRVLDPLLREYAKVRNFAETDPVAILERLYDDFADNSKTVQKRAFAYGTVTPGANSGDGTINRLTKDERNLDVENAWPDTWTAECIEDETSGARRHAERFEFRSGDPAKDALEQQGSGIVRVVQALTAADSRRFLDNPSFETVDGSIATPSTIPGWDIETGTIADFELVENDTYRGFPGDGGTPRAIRFKANAKLSQLLSVRRGTFDPRIPHYCQIAFKRESSCDGTLTVRLGAKTFSATLAAQVGWTVLRIALDDDCWHRNFNEQDFDFEVELSSRTTGTLLVDDVVLGPFTRVGGLWYAAVGGATPFLRRDSFTWSDTIAADAVIQRWLWWLYDRYLPHAASTPTWAEP